MNSRANINFISDMDSNLKKKKERERFIWGGGDNRSYYFKACSISRNS